MPLLGDPGHRQMVESLQAAAKRLPRPSAILVVSAHWEEGVPTLTSGANPPLIYDYYGFPEESYSIEYPCPGEPVLADKVRAALEQAGIDSKLDRSEEHTSELQSRPHLVCRLLLEKKKSSTTVH